MILNRGLIVSCQAVPGEPLYGYGIMHLFAKAAKEGGACGIRALCDDVDSIRREVNLPVIGLVKRCCDDSPVYITPTKADVDRLLATTCDVICMDATMRKRPLGETLEQLYEYARANANGRELLADVSTVEEAINADMDFVAECLSAVRHAKVIAEGGFFEVAQIKAVSEVNPYALVVGSAITRPKVITERLGSALKLK